MRYIPHTEQDVKQMLAEIGVKNIDELLPKNFSESKNLKRSSKAGIFSGSLELAKEGNISIKQNNLFDDIYIKQNK